jgi:hypothetical protein
VSLLQSCSTARHRGQSKRLGKPNREQPRQFSTLNALEVIANTLGITIFDLFDRVRSKATGKNTK